jgi:3',5'-cyclic AMP phosphodiesterase CpdA
MARGPSIAVTADLHLGHHARGDEAVGLLADFVRRQPPELLLLAGDLGSADHFDACLSLFDGLPGVKALVPGNHDIWVRPDDARGDSLAVYERHLPSLARSHGFAYLDEGPLEVPGRDLAVVGSMNWYDYSWSAEELRRSFAAEEWRLAAKRFTRGQHNDANFVRWGLDDATFTGRLAAALARHLDAALATASQAIVVTHHPPVRGLSFPEPDAPPDLDRLLWLALMGNRTVEQQLQGRSERIPLTFCGHTHRAREAPVAGGRGFNVGGDYHFKRLLWFDGPDAPAVAHQFGNAVR